MIADNIVAVLAIALCFVVLTCAYFEHHGYKKGVEDGYEQGRRDADNWWLGCEGEIDQARQEMWKKGVRR